MWVTVPGMGGPQDRTGLCPPELIPSGMIRTANPRGHINANRVVCTVSEIVSEQARPRPPTGSEARVVKGVSLGVNDAWIGL